MPGTLRRGLPRIPGGEPWPPADAAPPAAAAAPLPSETAAAPLPPETAAAPLPSETADGSAGAADRAVPAPASADRAPASEDGARGAAGVDDGRGAVLRRGLPRVPGGEPWPPVQQTIAATPVPRPAAPADAVPASAEATPAATLSQADASGSGTTAAPAGADRARGEGAPDAGEEPVSVRRGLPRAPGAPPWPPVDTVARVRLRAAEPSGAASVEHEESADEKPADAPPQVRPTRPEAVPASAGEPAPDESPAVAAALVPAAPRSPLPFTPTVWPGAAASAPRAARPEPKRYGPFTRVQWAGAAVVTGATLLIAAGMAVALVRWWLSTEWGEGFLAAYPGEYHLPEGAPVGFPAWLGWQHFFNAFLIVLIIRSGLQVRREKRPTVFWSPRGSTKRKISLALWFHQALDILWLANGAIFVVLLFVTGQWMRIVPTSWEVFPNAVSAALQYVSLNWPTENGWVNYNSLQQLAYFATVFVAGPMAVITGVRMSGVWPKDAATLNRIYPVEWARRVHFPVMIYFVLFIIAHVVLVFATGALRNLNHMYAAQDAVNWTGFWIFVASVAVTIAAWVAARPLLLAPIARLFGDVKGR